jgi:hypothetical protein
MHSRRRPIRADSMGADSLFLFSISPLPKFPDNMPLFRVRYKRDGYFHEEAVKEEEDEVCKSERKVGYFDWFWNALGWVHKKVVG